MLTSCSSRAAYRADRSEIQPKAALRAERDSIEAILGSAPFSTRIRLILSHCSRRSSTRRAIPPSIRDAAEGRSARRARLDQRSSWVCTPSTRISLFDPVSPSHGSGPRRAALPSTRDAAEAALRAERDSIEAVLGSAPHQPGSSLIRSHLLTGAAHEEPLHRRTEMQPTAVLRAKRDSVRGRVTGSPRARPFVSVLRTIWAEPRSRLEDSSSIDFW